MIGHRRAALVSDAVEKPDDIGPGNAVDLARAEFRQHMPFKRSAALANAAQSAALPSEIFLDDGPERVALRAFGLTPLVERVAAFGYGAEDRLGFFSGRPRVSPCLRCMRLDRPSGIISRSRPNLIKRTQCGPLRHQFVADACPAIQDSNRIAITASTAPGASGRDRMRCRRANWVAMDLLCPCLRGW